MHVIRVCLWGGGGSIIAITRLASLISADIHRQIITCISPDDSEGGVYLIIIG